MTPPAEVARAGSDASVQGLRAMVEAVDDMRSTRERTGCRVTLSLFGDDLDDVAAVTDTHVNAAQDDLGRSLLPSASGSGDMFLATPFIRLGGFHPALHSTVFLRNPSRTATAIKTLDVTVHLYSPTADNGAIAPIALPLPPVGTPLANDALAKNGIELVQLTPEQEREFRSPMIVPNPMPESEQRRLEAVAAEVARRRALREAGSTGTPASPTSNATAALPGVAPEPRTTVRPLPVRVPIGITFRVTDPNHRLVALEWSGDSGRMIRPFMVSVSNDTRLLRSTEPQGTDWQLIAYIATDGSVQSRDLHLENIALP